MPRRAACQSLPLRIAKVLSSLVELASLPVFCRHPFVAEASCVPSPFIARSPSLVELPACLHSAGIRSCRGELCTISLSSRDLRAWSSCQPACILQASVRAGTSFGAISFHRKVFVPGRAASLPASLQASVRAEASFVPSPVLARSPRLVKLPACLHSAGIRSCCGELRARILPSRIARSPCLVKLPACLHSAGIRSCCGELRARILPSRIARSPCLVELPACLHSAGIRSCQGELRARNPAIAHRKISVPGQAASLPAFCRHPFALGQTAWQTPAIAHRKVLRAWSSCQPACILQASVRARASCVPSPVIARSSYLVELSACLHSAVIRSCCGELRARLLPSRIAKSPCLVKLPACLHSAGIRSCCGELRARLLPSRIARSPCLVKLPACLHSAGIRSCCGERRARILPSRIARSPCLVELPACLQTPAITHRKVSVPGQATSLPAFCRHPLVLWRAACQNPLPSRIARSPCLVELPACLHSAGIRSCQGELRARILPSRIARSPCLVKLPACLHSAGIRSRWGKLRGRLLPSRIARSPCLVELPACLHSAGIRSCQGELRAITCHREIFVSGRAVSLPAFCSHPSVPGRASCHLLSSRGLRAWSSCQPACILQASVRARASCVPSPVIARIFVSGSSCQPACIPAVIRSCCGELRARLLPSRIAKSPCTGQATSLPAFCRHPLVLWRAACQNPAIAHRTVSMPGRAASLPADSCHHASQSLRAWSSYQPACILQASARAVASCVPDSCHRASQDLRAWSSCQPACILQASARAVASCVPESCHRASQDLRAWSAASLPAFCRHPFALGQTAWQTPAIAHRKVSVPGRAASLPAFCRHPFVPGRAACHHLSSRDLRIWSSCQPACILQSSARAVVSCVPDSCHHASQSLRAWSSYQPACILQGIRSCCGELRAITCHREIFVSGRAVSLPAFCSHPSVPGRASCHLLSSRGLRAWSSCQPACIFAGIRSQPGRAACQNPAIAHRKISVPGQAVSLPAFCRHPFVPWRAACQTPAIAHRKIFRAWSSFQPACILQASVRARASCVPESCHRAS
ncbi:uncharacterized protein [Maniola hyperantus]|uniref:uncharacterized protein isoform X36 n=1 Tax=Aphantopus hyperantus TaxID=2795564 RepID=UPI0037493860